MSRALKKFITVIVKITIRITVAILLKEGVVTGFNHANP